MPGQIETHYLSGADRGKHVHLMVPGGKHTGPWELEGELGSGQHWADELIDLTVNRATGPRRGTGIPANTLVTITGKAS